ncbi:dopamine beta-hydroxylase [Daphnia magna]|uniref:dopamine beta-hydroxylase n=1 Tax=Daphnia magna TaxID=35525 RepID=UPI001E1BA913|nr:dopamine beta-hydroxylase [Daphnia magna]XP_045032303.1 dopamine beta-hydroxylase [Daphnia magna]XP_045032304.1 dopamine beta-hydroxylase [Daphnia magna]
MSVLLVMILFFTTAFVHDSVQQSPDYLDEPLDWRNRSASHRDGQGDRLHRHGHAKRSVDDFSDDERHIYALTLDPDSKFKLSWTPDFQRQQVKFHVDISHSAPQSWFALGFSDRGDWPGADLCIGWEDWKGSLVVQDAHVDVSGIIHVDEHHNDCRRASYSRRQDGLASLEFVRSFDTCHRLQEEKDYLIEDGTVHVVYASGPGPLYRINGVSPSDDDVGFQRTRLLKPATGQEHQKTNDPLHALLIANVQLNIPAQETTYYCRVVRLPQQFIRKHHVVQFEAAIQEGRESLVHHMEVFHCEAPPDETIPEYRGPCTDPNRPESTRVCKRVLAAWAYGAGPFRYPPEAGLPIGGPAFNLYIMLEVHYNNPTIRGDWVDSSGVRLWYTNHLRQYDAGVMELGLEYTDKMAIPPGQESFTLTGYCLPQCTAVSLPKTGITIFGSQLHTHLLGYRVVTQHFRAEDGMELAELDRDNHYSTHYQEIRLLANPVKVFPGDALLTTCWFDTTDKLNVSLGGFSISDEMCVNYVHYFPRINLEVCKSSVSWQALRNYFQFVNQWDKQPTSPSNGVSDNYHAIEWTRLRAETLRDYYSMAPISMQCNQSSGERFPGNWEGLASPGLPLPLPDTRNNVKPCESRDDTQDEYVPD